RFSRDWSSDVCSSDLEVTAAPPHRARHRLARGSSRAVRLEHRSVLFTGRRGRAEDSWGIGRIGPTRSWRPVVATVSGHDARSKRSEERRVGNGWETEG